MNTLLILFGIIALACMVRSYHNAAKARHKDLSDKLDRMNTKVDSADQSLH